MNLHLQNKVIVIVAGTEERDAAIIAALRAEEAIPCFILADFHCCLAMVDDVVRQYGRVDGLVNSLPGNDWVGLEDGGYQRFVQSLDRSMRAGWMIAERIKALLAASQGSIVQLVSHTAMTGQGGSSGYAASNGMRIGLVEAWAAWGKMDVRVNGVMVSEGASLSGLAAADGRAMAGTVAFLLSPLSAGMQGELVWADGGFTHIGKEV